MDGNPFALPRGMKWVRLIDGIPAYSGRLRRPATFETWTRTEGADIIAALAAQRRFTIFGRTRAARTALWAELQTAAEKGPLADAIRACVQRFVLAAGEVAVHPITLPRATIDGYRLVVVPRVTSNARGLALMTRDLEQHPVIAALSGGSVFRDYFLMELFNAMDRTLIEAAPSLRRPVPTGEGWYIVGFDSSYSWHVPLARDAERRGHFFVYEAPPGAVRRWPRREIEARIGDLRTSLAILSRLDRDQILRNARATATVRPIVPSPTRPPRAHALG